MTKSEVRAFASEARADIRDWLATGGLWDIPRFLAKVIGSILLYAGVLVGMFVLTFAVGILYGTYLRFMDDGSRLYYNVGKNLAIHVDQTSERNANTFEAKTVSNRTPFIALKSMSRHWKDLRLSDTEVISREYFKTEMLPPETAYIPWLWEPTAPGSPIKITPNDRVEYIAVVLIEQHPAEVRMGLIPLDDYEEFLRRSGRAKKGGS